jgi:drug/metabolite transporter (DMT)-like permease
VKLLIIVIMAALTICLTVAANLFLKKGANEPSSTLILGFIGWKTLAGWMAFGFALIAYTLLLRYVPLHFAASITSAKFIGVVLAAWFILNERIVGQQWIGILLIAIGITVVSLAATRQSPSADAASTRVAEEAP